jgi:hypothetical protein
MGKRSRIQEGCHRLGIALVVIVWVLNMIKNGLPPTHGLPEFIGALTAYLLVAGFIYGLARGAGRAVCCL